MNIRYGFLCLLLLLTFPLRAQHGSEPTWQQLDAEGTAFFNEERYDEALEVFKKAVVAARKEFGENHVNYGSSLQSLAVLYLYTGEYELSETNFIEALRIHAAAVGKENEEYCSYLNGLISLYMTIGNEEKALAYYEESLPLTAAVYGKTSDDYLTSLTGLADQYMNSANFKRAEELLLEGHNLSTPLESSWYGDFCASLFQLYAEQGNATKAEPYFENAKALRNKLQEEFWETVDFKNMTYLYEIDDQEARVAYWENQVEELRTQDESSTAYASALMNLSILYQTQEDYAKAEPLLQRAMDIIMKKGTWMDYASACNGFAWLYDNMGNEVQAEKYYNEEIKVKRKVLGRAHLNYGTACNNQSTFYINRGELEKGELLAKTALLVFANLNDGYTYYAAACQGLALLYAKQQDYAKAEAYHLETERIFRMAFGADHYTYSSVALSLGLLYEKQGKLTQSEPLLVHARNINEKVFGKEHVQYAGYSYELARYYQRQQHYVAAEPLFKEAVEIKLKRITDNFGNLSEKEKRDYFRSGKFYIQNYAYCLLKSYEQKKSVAGDLFNLQLNTKGMIYQSTVKTRQKILASGDVELIKQFDAWTAKRDYLAKVYTMAQEEMKKKGIDQQQLEEEVNRLEKELTIKATERNIAGFEEKRNYSWQEVKSKLKQGEAVVEIVRAALDGKQQDALYGALIITDKSQQPELVVLPNGKDLETRYIKYYTNAVKLKTDDTESYQQFWKPIADKLEGIHRIYFSPDGVYHQISVGTLKNTNTKKYLLDEQEIVVVGSSKDLLIQKPRKHRTTSMLLMGFPDYKGEGESATPPQKDVSRDSNLPVHELTAASERYFDRASGAVIPLPGTQTEVKIIHELMQEQKLDVRLLTGKQANEEEIKQASSPTVLHIATHGFFLADQNKVAESENSGRKKPYQDPLLRSGLLLAGCENSLKGLTTTQQEDGILTAFEALNLSLEGTDLVVLSACETGLGEIDNGEGVYGLQRAFQQAGARFVLSSLWKVDDAATQLLMTTFYREYLRGGSYAIAFAKARDAVREEYKDAYYWGAFVLVGI